MTKFCIHCEKDLALEAFGQDKSTNDGLRRWCRDCTNEGSREKYKEHPDYRAKLMKRYGITEQQYNCIRNVQDNSCYICGAAPERLVVDHDHATGLVRGLLCRPCNFMLGNCKESPDILRKGAEYLETRQSSPLMIDWQTAQNILRGDDGPDDYSEAED